jgi:hypothetical protein
VKGVGEPGAEKPHARIGGFTFTVGFYGLVSC